MKCERSIGYAQPVDLCLVDPTLFFVVTFQTHSKPELIIVYYHSRAVGGTNTRSKPPNATNTIARAALRLALTSVCYKCDALRRRPTSSVRKILVTKRVACVDREISISQKKTSNQKF